MRNEDYEQLKYILADTGQRKDDGKQKLMGTSELARQLGC
jgi:hypothetical protein